LIARLDVAAAAVALGDAPGEALDRAARLGVAAVALGDALGEALDREARLDGAVAAVEILDLHVLDILQPAVAPVDAPVGHPEGVEIGPPKAHDGAAGVKQGSSSSSSCISKPSSATSAAGTAGAPGTAGVPGAAAQPGGGGAAQREQRSARK
jgi:hypothetical protein